MLLTDNISAEKFAFISNFPFKKKKNQCFVHNERLGIKPHVIFTCVCICRSNDTIMRANFESEFLLDKSVFSF